MTFRDKGDEVRVFGEPGGSVDAVALDASAVAPVSEDERIAALRRR
jgi:hypothetical protein